LRQNGAYCHREKTHHVAVRRPDTLCVRRAVSLFLLKQWLVAFSDSNYGRETTLIMTINKQRIGEVVEGALAPMAPVAFASGAILVCAPLSNVVALAARTLQRAIVPS
jgi:hypothetical protein